MTILTWMHRMQATSGTSPDPTLQSTWHGNTSVDIYDLRNLEKGDDWYRAHWRGTFGEEWRGSSEAVLGRSAGHLLRLSNAGLATRTPQEAPLLGPDQN
jgi:hypothetical protein